MKQSCAKTQTVMAIDAIHRVFTAFSIMHIYTVLVNAPSPLHVSKWTKRFIVASSTKHIDIQSPSSNEPIMHFKLNAAHIEKNKYTAVMCWPEMASTL